VDLHELAPVGGRASGGCHRRRFEWFAQVREGLTSRGRSHPGLFPLVCPACGGDIRLISFITDPGPIRKILMHVGEPVEPPPVSPARGPPTEWTELVQGHDDRDVMQSSPDELPVIDIHSL